MKLFITPAHSSIHQHKQPSQYFKGLKGNYYYRNMASKWLDLIKLNFQTREEFCSYTGPFFGTTN